MSPVICLFRWFAHFLKLGPVIDVPSLINIVPGVRLFLTGCFSKHLHTAEEKAIATHSRDCICETWHINFRPKLQRVGKPTEQANYRRHYKCPINVKDVQPHKLQKNAN